MAKNARDDDATVGGPGPCGRLVREALGRLATPEVLDRILVRALTEAALAKVPDDGVSFGTFACGALRGAVEETLGEEAASAVVADLSPAFVNDGKSAQSGVRRRKRASLAAPRPDSPTVLIGSQEPALVDALSTRLKEWAKVIATYDVFALLSAAGQPLSGHVTVLLHDDMPAVRPSTLTTLGRVLPPGARIIVWGATDVHPEQRGESASLVEWLRLGDIGDVDAVADVCIALWPQSDTDPPAVAPGLRVVVAHEDSVWRARLTRLLVDAGYVPVSAPDGFMALERCVEETPSAVIAGLEMTNLDGPQLAAFLHRRFGEGGPPVLLIAEGALPEPPPGVVAVISSRSVDSDLLPELAAWLV